MAILVAIVHGATGELRVFAKARIDPRWTRNLLRAMWQASTIDWTGIGLLLIAAPLLGSQVARQWIIGVGTPPSATRWPRADGSRMVLDEGAWCIFFGHSRETVAASLPA